MSEADKNSTLFAIHCSLFDFLGLFKLQDLVKSPPSPKMEIYIRQAGPGSYRQVLRDVRHKEIYKLIIDTDPMYMQQFFRAVSPYAFAYQLMELFKSLTFYFLLIFSSDIAITNE